MYWNPVKTEREDGQCHAPLVLSFPNGFKAQNERQTSKNNDDSRPQESILFSALSGLKDVVRLRLCARVKMQNTDLYGSKNHRNSHIKFHFILWTERFDRF